MKYLLLICLMITLAVAQEAHIIPFASNDNTIELLIANTSVLTAEGIKVEVINAPVWLKFTSKNVTLPKLNAKEEQMALFSFSVEKNAEVNKEQTLNFAITDKNGQTWKKEIKIQVAAPATFELFQNYPNPFNPTTVISYQLSAVSNVSLRIYDALGREVAHLVDEQQEPGEHLATVDARQYASGMYIYRLIATDEQKNRHVFQKKMLMLK